MRVAMISRSDESVGGASRAAHLLATSLRNLGCDVDEWIIYQQDKHSVGCRLVFGGVFNKHIPYLTNIGSRLIGLPDLIGLDLIKLPKLIRTYDYDLIHFHDTVTAISPITILRAARMKPTVVTLHDCSAFTAGCIYPDSCNNYITGCCHCPQIRTWPMNSQGFDFSGLLQLVKRKIHAYVDISVIAPSAWIRQKAIESGVFPKEPELIPYGVSIDTIRPLDKGAIRNVLGLPIGKPIIAFAATHVDDSRKGFIFALEAVRKYQSAENAVILLAIGHPPRDMATWNIDGLDCRFIGFIHDIRLLGQFFAAADVFLFPTLHDNLPFVVLENMAAGTPTVGFRTGGVPEMILHGQTGYVAEQGNVEGLVRGLKDALHDGKVEEWSSASRRRAEQLYSLENHARTHLRLYQSLIMNTGCNKKSS